MTRRKLTANEISFAKKIFADSIKYSEVHIYDEKYAFFQPINSGMTPNGNIYVDGVTSSDYGKSTSQPFAKAFFIHEMVHVWQKQNGVLNPIISAVANSLRHGFFYSEAYKYTLDGNKDLLDYRMEQQAQIIEDYVRIKILNIAPNVKYIQNQEKNPKLLKLFNNVLSKLIAKPSYPSEKVK